ncbi:MAG: hypothetical protein KBE23_17135 [Chloroflexi bacterium]|nr:hypothetical protein [Chloroflexota bacterium]MBP7044479.1 hypothetical protein [Chloroflexota bacterium]
MKRTVVLRDVHDNLGSRYLAASFTPEGNIKIEGQDLGSGVEQVFGEGIREYEWVWVVKAAHIPALEQALGEPVDVLESLKTRFSGDQAALLKKFLDDQNIPLDPWSRLGD